MIYIIRSDFCKNSGKNEVGIKSMLIFLKYQVKLTHDRNQIYSLLNIQDIEIFTYFYTKFFYSYFLSCLLLKGHLY